MNKRKIINNTARYSREKLSGESSGHDWWHTQRVWKTAVCIGKREKADMFVIELAALLHDIADFKFHKGNTLIGAETAKQWLTKQGVDKTTADKVCEIVKNVSFKGAGVKSKIKTKEGMVVQDADRLDAMGAIGIGRVFAFGGARGKEMYNPKIKPKLHKTFGEYKNSKGTTINHFYEKLLLLKDLMNTKTGKVMAKSRHEFMKQFLERFFREWKGTED